MSTKPGQSKTRYEVITQEDENGDVIIPVPLSVLRSLGWKDGDNVTIGIDSEGKLYLKKAHT
jgi:bifunctional DNA-binding transcriptional regulator/antitoxin component of YhaV-PrlF toxin-antitoxin module